MEIDRKFRAVNRLPEGGMAEGRLDYPDGVEFPGARPIAFLVPSSSMADLDGNGPSPAGRDTLHFLSMALNRVGVATYRFVPQSRPLEVKEAVANFKASLQLPRVDPKQVILLGVGEGADLIARNYYSFYPIDFPLGAALLSPSVSALHLNNLTCPYLILHGERDPLFEHLPYERIEEAVHHHQMRYGDWTLAKRYPEMGRELGTPYFSAEVAKDVCEWAREVLREKGLRPQEPAADSAA